MLCHCGLFAPDNVFITVTACPSMHWCYAELPYVKYLKVSPLVTMYGTTSCVGQREWSDRLNRSQDDSNAQVLGKEKRLREALLELEEFRRQLVEAREESVNLSKVLEKESEALSASRARTNELHKLGVDMERELTAMLEGKQQVSPCDGEDFLGEYSRQCVCKAVDLTIARGLQSPGYTVR